MPAICTQNKAEEGMFSKANTANKLEFKSQNGFLPSQPSHCLVFLANLYFQSNMVNPCLL